MEIAVAVGSLKAAYNLVLFGIKLDQVPSAVRRCLELVRVCHYDLQDLIKLRNESLPLLETKPAVLERVNTIIESAHKGLLEVCQLVEKLRPAAHDGHTPLMSRIEWLFFDASEFTSQEPLISRQHSSVIAELNFLRNLVLLTPLLSDVVNRDKGKTPDSNNASRDKAKWDNLALLDEMLGGGRRTSTAAASVPPTSTTPLPSEAPPPYSPPTGNAALLTAHRNTNSAFDSNGIELLFGNLKVSGEGVPPPPPIQTTSQESFYASFIQADETGSNLTTAAPTNPQIYLGRSNAAIKRVPVPQRSPQPRVSGSLSPPQQLHHRQSMPALHNQASAAAKPLSTISQELIHRYDGFAYSPPPQHPAPFVSSQAVAWDKLQEKSHQQRPYHQQNPAPTGAPQIYLSSNRPPEKSTYLGGNPSPQPSATPHNFYQLAQPQTASTSSFTQYNPSPYQSPQPQYLSTQSTSSSQFYTPPSSSYGHGHGRTHSVSSVSSGGPLSSPSLSTLSPPGVGLGVTQSRNPTPAQQPLRSSSNAYFAAQAQLPAGIGYFGGDVGLGDGRNSPGQGQGGKLGVEVRTEIYELPSVKFAPDPVEMP
ncbi:hypothetical protein QBC42DRAFT_293245 [Cladorrhinum samala]|uniref:Uncharacterized protein n=1 Tax=Cladorrhinum samala TaxID=585594 RepID=A0AAV9I5F3_9PEZI|nr:hypothetical protein QBC42DRAFT_293245 [Cladorrhinum samala]